MGIIEKRNAWGLDPFHPFRHGAWASCETSQKHAGIPERMKHVYVGKGTAPPAHTISFASVTLRGSRGVGGGVGEDPKGQNSTHLHIPHQKHTPKSLNTAKNAITLSNDQI